MKTKLPVSLFLSALLFISCSKTDKINPEPAPERPARVDSMANIADKYFIRVRVTSDPAYPLSDGTTTTDIYKDWYRDPCVLDDLRMFQSNGDYLWDNGATKCDAAEAQTTTYKWKFIEDYAKIQSVTSITDTLKVLINDGTTLKFDRNVKKTSGGVTTTYVWTETWTKKQ